MHTKYSIKVLSKEQITIENSDQTMYRFTLENKVPNQIIEAGQTVAIYPVNEKQLVKQLLERTGFKAEEPVTIEGEKLPLKHALTHHLELSRLTRKTINNHLKYVEISHLREMQDDTEKVQMFLEGKNIVDFLHEVPVHNMQLNHLLDILEPIKPRHYFITKASTEDNILELMVTQTQFTYLREQRKGTCTSYLIDRVKSGDTILASLPEDKCFKLPSDSSTDIIMIGAEGGIAPYRSFLQNRDTTNSKGKNWLLFSAKNEKYDFPFKDEILNYQKSELLHKFDTVYKNDREQSIYVQHKLREYKTEILDWVENGAHLYVCADTEHKVLIVHNALTHIVAELKEMKFDDAEHYLHHLLESGQYQKIAF